jgi:hypothetical protein
VAVAAALAATTATAAHATPPAATVRLPVPLIRQAPERCGPAALAMVLRYYGADSTALAETERAYDPVLRVLRYLLHDGGAHERWMARSELLKRWKSAGSRALIVRRP